MQRLPAEVLTEQQQNFIRLITVEGLPVPKAAEHPQVAVAKQSAYRWLKNPLIKNAIAEYLEENKSRNQMEATKRLQAAWGTVDKAMKNPNVTPTMLKAAVFTIMQANGATKEEAEKGVTFHLEVNTQLNMNALAEQQARHSKPQPVYEGGFTVVDDDA